MWVIPGDRMKSGKEHRVPLAAELIAMLRSLPRKGAFVFPGGRGMPTLGEVACTLLAKELAGDPQTTTHGLRSTFRDWAAERTNFPREVCEAALSHVKRDKVEAAYQRSDLLDKRRQLMKAWAKFCGSPASTGDVVPLRA